MLVLFPWVLVLVIVSISSRYVRLALKECVGCIFGGTRDVDILPDLHQSCINFSLHDVFTKATGGGFSKYSRRRDPTVALESLGLSFWGSRVWGLR